MYAKQITATTKNSFLVLGNFKEKILQKNANC